MIPGNRLPSSIIAPRACQPQVIRKFPLVRAMFPSTDESPAPEPTTEFLWPLACECLFYYAFKTGQLEKKEYCEGIEPLRRKSEKRVEAQFRQASQFINADDFGDKYTEQIAALNEAYEWLKDPEYRHFYLVEMIDELVWTSHEDEDELIHDSHNHFVREMENMEEWITESDNMHSTDGQGRLPYFESQMWKKTKPRRLGVQRTVALEKIVELAWQPLQPIKAFQEFCDTVVIVISDETKISIDRVELEGLYDPISQVYTKTIHLKNWGNYSAYWYAELLVDDNGTCVQTENSDSLEIQITHPEYEYAVKNQSSLLEQARKQTGALKRELNYYKSHQKTLQDRVELERRQTFLVDALKAIDSTIEKLGQNLHVMNSMEPEKCSELSALKEIRVEAAEFEQGIAFALESLNKKENFKSFGKTFTAMLKGGEAVEWIAHVSKEEIYRLGADTNRLYQLLIENKKCNDLIHSSVLQAAAARSDLFHPKHCEVLLRRSSSQQARKQGRVSKKKCGNKRPPSINSEDTASTEAEVSTSSKTSTVSPSPPALSPLTISSGFGGNTSESDRPEAFPESSDGEVVLLKFLQTQSSCLKCSPEEFYGWLLSQDVDSLETFWEASCDEMFLYEMQRQGIKGFKRFSLKESLSTALSDRLVQSMIEQDGNGFDVSRQQELDG